MDEPQRPAELSEEAWQATAPEARQFIALLVAKLAVLEARLNQNSQNSSFAQTLLFMLSVAVLLLWTAGVVALTVQRLLHEVRQAQDAEREALIASARDAEQRQEQLEAREALLRSISDTLPDGLIFQLERAPDERQRYRYLSAGVTKLWGVAPEVAYADPEALRSRIHPEDRPGYELAARQSREAMRVFEYEMRVYKPDGQARWAFVRSTPHLLPDGRILHSGVELDITARKQVEADLQRRIHELTVLYQITHALTSWIELSDALGPVVALLREVFGAEAITVWEHDAQQRCLRPAPGLAAPPGWALPLAELDTLMGLLLLGPVPGQDGHADTGVAIHLDAYRPLLV